MNSYPCYNRLMSLRLRRMARYGALFKVLHADPTVVDATPDNDMVLYVLYSLNKQKRWEIQWELCESYLQTLQQINSSMETMVLQRCLTDPFRAHWSHIVPHFDFIMSGSKVRRMHCLPAANTGKPYLEQGFGGSGRFINESRKKKNYEAGGTKIVTYNIVRAPTNYRKLFECDFRKWRRSKDSTYHRKCEFDTIITRDDWGEYVMCCERCEYWSFGGVEDEDEDDEDHIKPPKFYNLIEHLVEPRRTRRSRFDRGFVIL